MTTLAFGGYYSLSEWTLSSALTRPHEISIDSLGMIWFTGKGSASEVGSIPGGTPPPRVGKLDPSSNQVTEWPLPSELWNGTADNLSVDVTGQGTVVWFNLRWLEQPIASRIARLTLNSSNIGLLRWWFPEDPGHYATCLHNGTVLIHGLDTVRNSTANIASVWFLKEVDSSPGGSLNCGMRPGPYQITGSAVTDPFGTNSTVHVTSYYPQGLVQAAGSGAGDFLMVDPNHTVWFASDDANPPTVYHLNPVGCPPTCGRVYSTWPIYTAGSLQGQRPQAMALDADGALWLEDRAGFTLPNGTEVSLLERHDWSGSSISISVWTTPHLIIDGSPTISQISDESDLLIANSATNVSSQFSRSLVWFTEHWANRVVAFDPSLQGANVTGTVSKVALDANVTEFDVVSNATTLSFDSYAASFSQTHITCSAPTGFSGFSECPGINPPLSGAGPNGLAYQSGKGCIWFTEQDADKIGRLCPSAALTTISPSITETALGIALITVLAARLSRWRAYPNSRVIR